MLLGPLHDCLLRTHIANIFGFAKIVDEADRVTYNSALDDAFHVYKNGKETIFGQTPNNLYAFTPPTTYNDTVACRKNMLLIRDSPFRLTPVSLALRVCHPALGLSPGATLPRHSLHN